MPPSMLAPSHNHQSPQSRSSQRKSPPPPSLNLDDLKPPILPAPAPSASSSTTPNGTAFVFSSSRHHHGLDSHPLSPVAGPSQPSSNTRTRALLTPSQLARHSEGAIDARCILGPNMRAAGFVHLAQAVAQSPHHHPPGVHSPPSTPGSSASHHSTPADPPPFPPIMFVSSSSVTTMPMWEYQRSMSWQMNSVERHTLTGREVSSAESHGKDVDIGTRPTLQPSYSGTTVFSPASLSASPSFYSASTLVSPSPTSPNVATASRLRPEASFSSSRALAPPPLVLNELRPKSTKGKEVDLKEYPFPRTITTTVVPPSPVSTTPTTATPPTFASLSSPHHPSHRARRKSKAKPARDQVDRASSSDGISLAPTHRHTLSLTELCDLSWTAPSDTIVPTTASSVSTRSVSRASSQVTHSTSSSSSSRDRARVRTNSETLGAVTEAERDATQPSPKPRPPQSQRRERAQGAQERSTSQLEKEALTALAYAHRERDREHARHVAADRESYKKQPNADVLFVRVVLVARNLQRRHSYAYAHIPKYNAKGIMDDVPTDAETLLEPLALQVVGGELAVWSE
ncbi:hypothetical protein POSPLADRAFT_1058762 [Postia placenta MAD-698-R-SB12]|uniref:Uncharacterized protein n=1 Tax=Postia placenta MAD-698-R-SB12 TaxID=670580 RepID=A0A1X6MW45_9APHY|nr:hypothetical protein POSPLADRAFT_1058762 [Postia placenta MAD-698-R-SB12]OSX60594.1 hypothetical protein POSPLADRAFT_1058762 [Postia placenta MAD-698-R-SB12]